MLMQLKNKMTKTATKADFTTIMDSSDVLGLQQCSVPYKGIVGVAF